MYDVEIQGLKFGKIICRIKSEESSIRFDIGVKNIQDRIITEDKVITFDDFIESGFDRIKLFVDDSEWINKSLVTIDFSSFNIGEMYEMSDDNQSWKTRRLDAINEENEHPFVTYGEGDNLLMRTKFAWRYAREVTK